MSCDISRWVLIFQDELRHKSIHTKDTRHWKWWKLLLMPSNVCAIPEYPLLLALYLDTKRRLKKLFLEEMFNIWLYHWCFDFHFQCWWWWCCEILMVKDFITSPQISFSELKLDLSKKWGWDFGSPLKWLGLITRLEILLWRPPYWSLIATPIDQPALPGIVVFEVLRGLFYQEC